MTSDETQAVFDGYHWLLTELDCSFGKAYAGINNKDFFFTVPVGTVDQICARLPVFII